MSTAPPNLLLQSTAPPNLPLPSTAPLPLPSTTPPQSTAPEHSNITTVSGLAATPTALINNDSVECRPTEGCRERGGESLYGI